MACKRSGVQFPSAPPSCYAARVFCTAAPFLIALGSSWIGLRTWREPFNRASFIATWVITVFVGLLLRRVVFDRGIATAFIIVATITLGVLLGLGRLLSQRLVRR